MQKKYSTETSSNAYHYLYLQIQMKKQDKIVDRKNVRQGKMKINLPFFLVG